MIEPTEPTELDRAAQQRNRALAGVTRLREWTLARYAVVLSEHDDAGRRRLAVEDLEALADALAELPGILTCGHWAAGEACIEDAVALDDVPCNETDYTTEPRCADHRAGKAPSTYRMCVFCGIDGHPTVDGSGPHRSPIGGA